MKTLRFLYIFLPLCLFLTSCERNENKPVFHDQDFYVDENSAKSTIVGVLEASDPDEGQQLSFEILTGNTNNAFIIDPKSGVLYVNDPVQLDFEKTPLFELQILVSDNFKDDPLESEANVAIHLNDLNEYSPEVTDQEFEIEEYCSYGSLIGTLSATDQDPGQELKYRIESGNDEQIVRLDSLTGTLYVEDASWFDYDINQELVCMFSVSDNDPVAPLRSYALLTIHVINTEGSIKDFNGYVQKGPFIVGSSIIIFELNESLEQTGRVFNTQINDNLGSYSLSGVELISPYVMTKADGFYFNERTGNLSESQLTLYGIVDVRDAETTNVNILSHLEMERLRFLLNSGLDFTEAKEQTRDEIFQIFNIPVDGLGLSEEMDISQAGADNARLLALSVILQGLNTTAELSELINNISLDISNDGTLDSEVTGTKLINGVNHADLPAIRYNLETRYSSLGMTFEIPPFEPYVNNFIANTEFTPSNQLVYPENGSYGSNFLDPEVNIVENLSEGSMAVEIPAGRSLKFKVTHSRTFLIAVFSGINMTWSSFVDEGEYGYNLFETTSSGLCDVNVQLKGNPERSNLVFIDYFEDGAPTPSYSKIMQINGIEGIPIDSTLLK